MLYAGIDEAGYGPLLGPLCVALCAIEVPWTEGAAAPDVWKLLSASVCKSPGKAGRGRTKIAVNDSKKLKLANSVKTRHPLVHLERGVLAFDALRDGVDGAEPDQTTDDMLFSRLGAALDGSAWYAGEPARLPVGSTADQQRLLNLHLASSCEKAGVVLHELSCSALCESEFNARLRGSGLADSRRDPDARAESKAAVSFGVVGTLLRRVWEHEASIGDAGVPPRVVVDRQGGRAAYAPQLERIFPDAIVRALGDTATRSVYDIEGLGTAAGRRMRVSFQVEAEQSHFPVALASMTAKLVRELAMARFNRYWCGRIAELKPTAGYALDGERWIRDARPVLGDDLVRSLRRLA